jgi:signal peptidase II
MSWFKGPHSRIGGIVAASAFVVDQAHKFWMINIYDIGARGRVTVTPFLDLVYMINPGVSYSFLEMRTLGGQLLLSTFALIVSFGIAIWMAQTPQRLTAIALGLIMGGALANALDRPLLGGVADFFSLHAYGLSWYVFNLADVAIVAGVAGLLYESLVGNRQTAMKSS